MIRSHIFLNKNKIIKMMRKMTILKITINDLLISNAQAINYGLDDCKENIIEMSIPNMKIRKNSGHLKYSERINNLFLTEFICSEYRNTQKNFTPICEKVGKIFTFNQIQCPIDIIVKNINYKLKIRK